jgi:tetratricopeptide (TPR) repeat protein
LSKRLPDAAALADAALTQCRQSQERANEPYALSLLGAIAAHADPPDPDSVEAYYRQAESLASALGMRPHVAHCHFALAKLYARTGQADQAQEHFTTATTMYREMDMLFWLEQVEAEMRQIRSCSS